MVDAGSHFAIPFYSGETNVAVGAPSTPIHVAALVVQIGRGHWLLQESLHPGFPSSIHQLGVQNDAARGEACCEASVRQFPPHWPRSAKASKLSGFGVETIIQGGEWRATPMKMGTTRSPWRYDAAAADAIRPDNQRRN